MNELNFLVVVMVLAAENGPSVLKLYSFTATQSASLTSATKPSNSPKQAPQHTTSRMIFPWPKKTNNTPRFTVTKDYFKAAKK